MYFIPNEQEPTTEPTAVLDPNSKKESVRIAVAYYNNIENSFRDLHEYYESVSNYEEYYEFILIAGDLEPIIRDLAIADAKMTKSITRLGLDDNTEINNAVYITDIIMKLTNDCIYGLVDKYGQ